ncbi:MAG: hypothetical protein KC800_19780 [Candidatus Eremiobacteraeota bacterium]|nr:hypothetical protein [Candidatus Eremiobacteraeota bacterium]
MSRRHTGHSLLETIVAAGIFVLVSVALSGVWVMYSKGLAKSAENMAASFLARSVTEGLVANGWDWLLTHQGTTGEEDFVVERLVRGKKADLKYHVTYDIVSNEGGAFSTFFSEDLCRVVVRVKWHSSNGKIDDGDYNNEEVFVSFLYKHGIE